MEERYNVYFAGQVMDGCEPRSVRDNLAKVFSADQTTLDKLFSGTAQLIKRNCDQATALQFKEAMERAGAVVIINVSEGVSTGTAPARAMTAADKIAALAAAPDKPLYSSATLSATVQALAADADAGPGGLALAPSGTEVLREDERAQQITREVDTSAIALDLPAKRLSEESPLPPAAPDTRHLSMADVGELIPNLTSFETPLSPSIDGMALTPPGTDFSDCAAPAPQATPRDLSALDVAPAGGTLLQEQYRRREHTAAPATDHISLTD